MQWSLSKSTNAENPVSWFSGRAHGLTLLVIVSAALAGSGLVSHNVAANSANLDGQKKRYTAATLAPAGRISVDAQEAAATETSTRNHFLKDGAVVLVCLLAASLWWLARSPSGPERLRPARSVTRGPLLLVSNPWNADEQERKQISRDLHDCVGQVLTAAGMELATLRSSTLPQDELSEKLASLTQLNVEALRLVKDLAIGLRPAMLDDVGLADALRWQVRQFSRHTGISGSIEVWGEVDQLPEAQRTCIYRCIQEALTNCARHSKAGRLEVMVAASPSLLTFTVEDDGVGLNQELKAAPGLGILGMHERVEALGGRLTIESRDHRGTRLMFEIPLMVGAHA